MGESISSFFVSIKDIRVPWLSFICVIWLNHIRAMTHSYTCHDSFTYVAWESQSHPKRHMSAMTLIHMSAMTHSYTCHDSFIHVPWLIHTRAMTHSYMWHDSFIWMSAIIHTRPCPSFPSHSWVMAHESLLIHESWCVHLIRESHWFISHSTRINTSRHTSNTYIWYLISDILYIYVYVCIHIAWGARIWSIWGGYIGLFCRISSLL